MNVGGINTTERCNLSCAMCYFNGPHAPALSRRLHELDERYVHKFMDEIPAGGPLTFCAHGEFFLDRNCLAYLRRAKRMGFVPGVITNGQLLTPEVIDALVAMQMNGTLTISVDTIYEDEYRRIRRGGTLRKIVDALDYLNTKYGSRKPFTTNISSILFDHNFHLQEEYVDFWTGRADRIFFKAEYYDTFKLRNLVAERPRRRNACRLALYLNPSGQIAPCCAIIVHNRQKELDWLPRIQDCTPTQAWHILNELYHDADSPFRQICGKCEWWIMFAEFGGKCPYGRTVDLKHCRQQLANCTSGPITIARSNYAHGTPGKSSGRASGSTRRALQDYYASLVSKRPAQDPFKSFFYDDAISINVARLAHVHSLGLPLEGKEVLEVGSGVGLLTKLFEDKNCRVISTEARPENVDGNLRMNPHRAGRVLQRDLTVVGSHDNLGSFDVVFCYGTLYHLPNPHLCIQDLARVTRELLLMETCVFGTDNGEVNLKEENRSSPNQAFKGLGCRPARNWVYGALKEYFPYVYIT
ncbi:MAG: radical SAM protein, partial [Planctomycetota bacterium]